MNNEIVPPIKRRRGRPRKKNSNVTAINKFPTFTPQTSYKRKAAIDTTTSSSPPEIEIISLNGGIDHPSKKPRQDDPDQPKRLQPPRRARFTESYGGTADVVLVEESDSESESDSDCSPVPSPVVKVRTREEQEAHDANIQVLRKALGDEEMKLVLLRKLRESQRAQGKRAENNASPLPTSLVAQRQAQPQPKVQPLPSKQLMTNKYIAAKRDTKPDVISNSGSSILKTSSSSQFKPIQSSFKAHQQPPYNKLIKQESVSSSSAEQLNSNHLNQYPLLKNLSNQITITAVPPTIASNGNNRLHQQQQQQQQQLQDEKNDAETLQQRQAAAKLALRKQLEKTLLQIPLPKPPPLKINFYPSANSMEYLCLLGLDFVVDFLTRSKRQPSSDQKDPLRCGQCETDFTCAWKWKEVDRDGRKVFDVFCEACITSNVRRALKAQHTNNLKSAFLKALQQEKEIDRLTIHTMPKTTSSSSARELAAKSSSSSRDLAPKSSLSVRDLTPKSSHTKSSTTVRDTLKSNRHHSRHHQDSPSSSGRQPSPAHQGSSSAFSIPKPGMALPYIPKSSQGINHAALAQLSKLSPQYQSLLQAQAQQLLAAGVPLHPGVLSLSPFMAQHHGATQRNKSDGGRRERERHRSPNIPHSSSSSWKA